MNSNLPSDEVLAVFPRLAELVRQQKGKRQEHATALGVTTPPSSLADAGVH